MPFPQNLSTNPTKERCTSCLLFKSILLRASFRRRRSRRWFKNYLRRWSPLRVEHASGYFCHHRRGKERQLGGKELTTDGVRALVEGNPKAKRCIIAEANNPLLRLDILAPRNQAKRSAKKQIKKEISDAGSPSCPSHQVLDVTGVANQGHQGSLCRHSKKVSASGSSTISGAI